MKILFEDNHLLVVIKPAGMPVQADASGDLDLLTYLKSYIKEKFHKPGNVYLGLVHRLDRGVGGVMVFARTSKAASRLSEQIRTHKFHKVYQAWVEGTFDQPAGRLSHYLLKDKDKNKVEVFESAYPEAKLAELEYRVLEKAGTKSLLEVVLITGRSHQIRAQLSFIGHPIVGDVKYGSTTSKPHIDLWAYQLSFLHPVSHKQLNFQAEWSGQP